MKKTVLFLVCIFIMVCILSGCTWSTSREEVNDFVKGLLSENESSAVINQTVYAEENLTASELEKYAGRVPNDLENYNVRYVKYEPIGALEQLNDYGQYNDILYPGAIVDISKPTVRNIGIAQSPITLSISLDTVTDCTFRPYVMKEPSLSNARIAVNKLVNNSAKTMSKYPTKLNMSVNMVDNSYDFNIAVGLSMSCDKLGFGDKFDYSTFNSNKSLVLTLSQVYYTIDVDAKNNAQEYFEKKLNSSSIKEALKSTNPAVVSSVSYGRVAIIKLSSDESMRKWDNDLSVGISGLFNVSTEISEAIKNKNVKADIFIYGGSINNDTLLGSSQDFDAIIKEFTSEINPDSAAAVPISYKFRNIYDFSLAKIKVANEPMYIKQYVKKNSVLRLTIKDMQMVEYPAGWFLQDFEMTGFKALGRLDIKDYNGKSIQTIGWEESSSTTGYLKFTNDKVTIPNTVLDICGIDNSNIISQDLVDLNLKFTFKVKCERSIFGLIPTGNNIYEFSGSEIVKGFDQISSVTGLYANFANGNSRIKVYFECNLI